MRTREMLEGLPVFLAVAEAGSFTRAAKKLGVSPSAASQAVRALEARIGTPLLSRSTRSLSLTSAGEAYLRRIGPAFATIEEATREAMGRAVEPSGSLRLIMPRAAYDGVIARALPDFRKRFPLVEIELEIEGGGVDIIERGFDAGLRYGRLTGKDMESVEVLGTSSSVLVAAPSYLKEHPAPQSPEDLAQHHAVICRDGTTGVISSWSLQAEGQTYRLDPERPMIASDLAILIDLTLAGNGIGCAPIQCVANALHAGRLVRILPDWASPLETLHLYYPKRGKLNAALQVLITHLLEHHADNEARLRAQCRDGGLMLESAHG